MSIQDILSSNFLDNVAAITPLDMALTLGVAFLLGLFIFFVYKKTFTGVMYSAGFGVALIAITMITAMVIMAVTSNLVLSLGMVGALSIVRFRAAIKEPLDIAYLFWCLAAGFLPLAVLGSAFIGLVLILFGRARGVSDPFILMLHCDSKQTEAMAKEFVSGHVKKLVMKSKSVSSGIIELNYEIRLKSDDTDFVNALSDIPGVSNAVLVSYTGDYMG